MKNRRRVAFPAKPSQCEKQTPAPQGSDHGAAVVHQDYPLATTLALIFKKKKRLYWLSIVVAVAVAIIGVAQPTIRPRLKHSDPGDDGSTTVSEPVTGTGTTSAGASSGGAVVPSILGPFRVPGRIMRRLTPGRRGSTQITVAGPVTTESLEVRALPPDDDQLV